MDKFEMILIAGIAITILLCMLICVFLVEFILTKKEITSLENNKPNDRKKRRGWRRELRILENKKHNKLKYMLFSLLGALLIGGASGYAKYYQSTTISDVDTDNIVYSYYLLDQMEQEIKDIDNKSDQKSFANIHTLAVSISSFSSKKGSDRSVEEAQLLLNKYYAQVGQLGVNLSSENVNELKKDKEKQTGYLDDITRVRGTQKKVLAYYKIDEASLKEKK